MPRRRKSIRTILRDTSQIIDGLLMVMPYPHLSYEALDELCQGKPFVIVNTELGAKMPSVIFDQRHGTKQAMEYLFSLGHRQIAEISGPLDNCDARERHNTWLKVAKSHNLEPGPSVVGNFDVYSGYTSARRLLDSEQPFTAILVGNDLMALGAMHALNEAGLRVPEDVSIVGFDDIEEAAHFAPPLTTVRQQFDVLGRESVEYLVSLIEDATIPIQQRVLYPELVVRQSVQSLI